MIEPLLNASILLVNFMVGGNGYAYERLPLHHLVDLMVGKVEESRFRLVSFLSG